MTQAASTSASALPIGGVVSCGACCFGPGHIVDCAWSEEEVRGVSTRGALSDGAPAGTTTPLQLSRKPKRTAPAPALHQLADPDGEKDESTGTRAGLKALVVISVGVVMRCILEICAQFDAVTGRCSSAIPTIQMHRKL
ncbi:hypothetical protein B0H11DRAFT_2247102 [Mycena galericulata]|nr:hypothetical protein B0H11DRAFT_2247102 [Mycena galericulata]